MHLLMLLFTSLYFSDPSGSNNLSQFSPFVAQIKNFCSDPGFFFFWRCMPRISLAVSVTAVLKVVIIESKSASSLFMMVRGVNLPWLGRFPTHWDLSAFRGQTWVLPVLACWFFFSRRWKVIISKWWPLPMSAHGKLRVLAMFIPDRNSFLTKT